MSHKLPVILSLLLSLLPALPSLPVILPNPNPDPLPILQQPFLPSPPATIPSSPEQSAVSGCPLSLPSTFFPPIKSSCAGKHTSPSTCCPVLATWLYSAFSDTVFGKFAGKTTSYDDMPLLPDDSETCGDGIEKVMREKGVEFVRVNETCDVVYCYCGIRLRSLSCPQAFRVSKEGVMVGDERVEKLEKDCLSGNYNETDEDSRVSRCSKCLDSLYKLKKSRNGTKSETRTSKMRMRDCDLMGLTWLLHKNRDAYISTVTTVMRALMVNPQDSDPQSCSLSSDGLPLAVDSLDINGQPSSVAIHFHVYLYSFALFLLFMNPNVLP